MEQKRKKAEYRSSIRSKLLIRNALVSLMREKPFEKITVTDIVKKADINRGTFYAHFRDTREVLDRIKADVSEEIKNALRTEAPEELLINPEPALRAISAFISRDNSYYSMLVSLVGVDGLIAELRNDVIDYVSQAERYRNAENKAVASCRLDFAIAGSAVFYYDVILGNSPISLEDAPTFLSNIIRSIMRLD